MVCIIIQHLSMKIWVIFFVQRDPLEYAVQIIIKFFSLVGRPEHSLALITPLLTHVTPGAPG